MKKETYKKHLQLLALLFVLAISVSAQTTAFNYQGKLTDAGAAANGAYQMQFKLFDAPSGGTQIGAPLSDLSVTAVNGVFSTKLDFGAEALSGANRWLEIAVRRNAGEAYVTLAPREQINSSPYSIRTLSAQTADLALDSNKLGGIAASEYVTNSNVGNSFIRNSTTLQTGNFNISGNGSIGGLVGLGTLVNNNFRLDSFGSIRAYSNASAHFVAETNGGTNTWARFYMRSPNRSWFMGTSQNFNGDQFYLADENAGQIRMAISTSGLVGFGTTNPLAGLELRGTGLQTQQRITDNTSGNSLVLQAGTGGNMKITGYNYGTSAAVPLYLSVDGANTVLNSGGGNVGIGTTSPSTKLEVAGTIKTSVLQITGGSDLAENFELTEAAKPGMVVAIDPQNPGKLRLARGAYDRQVAGIISGANDLSAGLILPDLKPGEKSMPLALTGRVWVYCDATRNAITPGDLLTTSDLAGYAMKVTNYKKAGGAIIGKAMTELKSGTGLVLVLVSLQ